MKPEKCVDQSQNFLGELLSVLRSEQELLCTRYLEKVLYFPERGKGRGNQKKRQRFPDPEKPLSEKYGTEFHLTHLVEKKWGSCGERFLEFPDSYGFQVLKEHPIPPHPQMCINPGACQDPLFSAQSSDEKPGPFSSFPDFRSIKAPEASRESRSNFRYQGSLSRSRSSQHDHSLHALQSLPFRI